MEEMETAHMKELIKSAKRNCLFCMGRSRLRDTGQERKLAYSAVERLYKHYIDLFNYLRKEDASLEEINKTKENKYVCLDAMDLCKKCDKSVDQINRAVNKLSNSF